MSAPSFKIGDVVRRRATRNASSYRVGDNNFTVAKIDHNGVTDIYSQWHMKTSLELVTPAPASAPEPAECADPRHEALIRANDSLQATIRRRNEEISELEEKLEAAESEIAEHIGPAHDLTNEAQKLGLATQEAIHALELGARALVWNVTAEDFTYLRDLKLRLAASSEGATA